MKESRTITNILLICLVLIMLSLTALGAVVAQYTQVTQPKKEENKLPFNIEMWWDPTSTFLKEYVVQTSPTEFKTIAKSDNEIVAPNTSGSIILRVMGCASVPFSLVVNLEEIYSDNWKTGPNGEEYHPILLNATSNLRGPEKSVEITNGTINLGVFEVNLELDGEVKITWEWPYHTSDAADDADSYMGSLGAEATYGINSMATATQVQ